MLRLAQSRLKLTLLVHTVDPFVVGDVGGFAKPLLQVQLFDGRVVNGGEESGGRTEAELHVEHVFCPAFAVSLFRYGARET